MTPRRNKGLSGAEAHRQGRITVIAGVNGAGKSSILGATIRKEGGRYFNPDEMARALLDTHPGMLPADANGLAWQMGRDGLERAVARHEDFAFETTLGGGTMTALLGQALDAGLEVVMRYVALDSPDRHIERVRARVALGGHDIPEATIRQRYTSSREHLIALLPRLTDVAVYDNSVERDPERDEAPEPTLLLHMVAGRILVLAPKDRIPPWAQAIVAAGILVDRERRGAERPSGEGPRTTGRRRRRS